MAKLIKEYGTVRCVSAEPMNEEKALEWSTWRKDYVGFEGLLNLYESERKYPGKNFFSFFSEDKAEKDWYLKAYCRQIDESQEKTLVFVTQNSRYTFEILCKENE